MYVCWRCSKKERADVVDVDCLHDSFVPDGQQGGGANWGHGMGGFNRHWKHLFRIHRRRHSFGFDAESRAIDGDKWSADRGSKLCGQFKLPGGGYLSFERSMGVFNINGVLDACAGGAWHGDCRSECESSGFCGCQGQV